MKKTIFILILMLTVGMTANAQDSFAKQFKGKEGFACVTIGKAAMKMMPAQSKNNLKIGSIADKVDRLEIVSASTPQAAEKLSKECKKWIEKDNFESVVDVDEQGNQASIFFKNDGGKNVFLLLANEKETTSVIIIYGTMTLEDLQGVMGGGQ